MPRHLNLILLLVVFLGLAAPLQNANAAGPLPSSTGPQAPSLADCSVLPAVDWREARTQSFSILYPAEQEVLGQALAEVYGETLDAEYARFSLLFETGLNLPVSIRLYPNTEHYYCLNPQAPVVAPGASHSHVGGREIALFSEQITPRLMEWVAGSLQDFRYEQAALFTLEVAGDKAPPGLVTGLSHWAQDPEATMARMQFTRTDWAAPTSEWQQLWDDPNTALDMGARLQATSIVAFLVDAYGWEPFLQFIQRLPTTESYPQALAQAYGVELAALQEQWRSYYPAYFSGRWRTHLIYNYDLSPLQEMVQSGDYFKADQELQEAVQFLERMNQTGKLLQARTLLEWARTGQQAEALVAQSRQAQQQGDYAQSITLLEEARQKYVHIQNYRRLDEMDAYVAQARQILNLHVELEQLRAEVDGGRTSYALLQQLGDLDRRMAALGDQAGQQQVRAVAATVEGRLQSWRMLLIVGVAWIITGLVLIRIWLSGGRPAPEADL